MKIIDASSTFITEINTDEVMLRLGIIAGLCYRGMMYNDNDLENATRIISNCVKNHHESVLEHYSVSISFNTSRDITHELVRHRLASFTQESTRYCNYSGDKFGNEIRVIDIWNYIKDLKNAEDIHSAWMLSCKEAEDKYFELISLGTPVQIARDVLPHSLATTIIVTANLREWRHILKLRTASSAHPAIRDLMIPVLKKFKNELPVIFSDIELPNK